MLVELWPKSLVLHATNEKTNKQKTCSRNLKVGEVFVLFWCLCVCLFNQQCPQYFLSAQAGAFGAHVREEC